MKVYSTRHNDVPGSALSDIRQGYPENQNRDGSRDKKDTALSLIEDNCRAADNSFLYLLHEKNVFDKDAFNRLLDCVNTLEEGTKAVLCQLHFIQKETLKHIIYHFDPNDMSRIADLPDDYWAFLSDLEDAVGKYERMCCCDRHGF